LKYQITTAEKHREPLVIFAAAFVDQLLFTIENLDALRTGSFKWLHFQHFLDLMEGFGLHPNGFILRFQLGFCSMGTIISQ
jgi:hypothetical protein